jgi:myo-inositol-1(or 4)-monophosphatase
VDSQERALEVAREAALAAGEIIARHAAGDRESWEKSEDNPVTQADLEANQAILEVLGRAYPDEPILSEETRDSETRRRHETVWIIDPLDGTKEFVAGIPEFAVSIARVFRGEPVVGVVYQPLSQECFAGARGLGASCNGEPSSVTAVTDLSRCVVLSSRTEMSRGQMDRYQGWFRELRPVGSVALKLAWVSAGRGDLWVSTAPKSEWDVCAGDLLLREAGGTFVTLPGGQRTYNQADVLLQPPMAAGSEVLLEAFEKRSRSC